MITKFTFPADGRTTLSSVGIKANGMIKDVRFKADDMLFWSDLYTIIYEFLNEEISEWDEAKQFFIDRIDFKCYTEYTTNKINIANSFYFYFD